MTFCRWSPTSKENGLRTDNFPGKNEAIALLTSRCKVREARRSIGRRPPGGADWMVRHRGTPTHPLPSRPRRGQSETGTRRRMEEIYTHRSLTRQRGNHLRKISVQQRTSENRVSIVVATSAIRFARGRSQLPDPVSRGTTQRVPRRSPGNTRPRWRSPGPSSRGGSRELRHRPWAFFCCCGTYPTSEPYGLTCRGLVGDGIRGGVGVVDHGHRATPKQVPEPEIGTSWAC